MTKDYFTYVLQCADQTLYCGYTTDLEKRIAANNNGKGAKYTKTRGPVQLVTAIHFDTKSEAMQCEWWFKHKLRRTQKLELIATHSVKHHFQNYQKARQK